MLLLRVVLYISDFKPQANSKSVYFDNKYISHDQKNIWNILLSAYVITVWKTGNRKSENSNSKEYDGQ